MIISIEGADCVLSGLEHEGALNVSAAKARIHDNDIGTFILLSGAVDALVGNNRCFDADVRAGADRAVIVGNHIVGNTIIDGDDCMIVGNVHDVGFGITIELKSDRNLVDGNRLINPSTWGIQVTSGAIDNKLGVNYITGAGTGQVNDQGTDTIDTEIRSVTYAQPDTLVTGNGKIRYPWRGGNGELLYAEAMVDTVATGASIISDVHKNGVTIFTTQGNRPTIAVSTNASGLTSAPDITAITNGDYITIDIDQVGSTIAGADLTVALYWRPEG